MAIIRHLDGGVGALSHAMIPASTHTEVSCPMGLILARVRDNFLTHNQTIALKHLDQYNLFVDRCSALYRIQAMSGAYWFLVHHLSTS